MSWVANIKSWAVSVKEFPAKTRRFLGEVRTEMSKVSFPSRDEVVGTTVVVLIASVVFAIYLWLADLAIQQGYFLIILRSTGTSGS